MGLSLLRKGRVGDVSLQRGIWQLAGVACGTLVVLCLLLSWSMDRYRQANDWVAHTLAILSQLNAYTRQITSLETAQRGYLLTQQADYLLPYWQVLNNRNNHFEQLNKLITDQDELRKLKRLAEILAAKKAELAQTIQLTQNGRLPEALAVVREGRGRRYTVEFQTLSREIGDRESAMLATRRAAVESQTDEMQIGVAIGCLLAMFLIIAAAIKTVGRFETRAKYLIGQLEATSEMRLEYPLEQTTRSGNKVLEAFDKMAARLLAARQAREATEADLAASNAELMRSNEELDGFAYGASHDLKAPLRGIRNLTEWIAEDVKDLAGEETAANLGLLQSRVERLDMLLDSLLQYSRVGRSGGAAEEIDVSLLVHDVATYIAPRPGFTIACRGEIPPIRADRAPLEQVLRNLIGNGLKHHDGDAGAVVVSDRDLGDRVEFRVEDDGPGIPPAFHDRIFKMFQTLKSRDTIEGSGMGLAIVKKSVERHGGTVWIESVPPRRGTAFVFTWKKDQLALAA